MKYKHDFAIKHLPKFAAGIFLIIFPGIAALLNLYVLVATSEHNLMTPILIMINSIGVFVGTTLAIESSEYTATEIPGDALSASDQLKRDIKS